jgi:putative transposase
VQTLLALPHSMFDLFERIVLLYQNLGEDRSIHAGDESAAALPKASFVGTIMRTCAKMWNEVRSRLQRLLTSCQARHGLSVLNMADHKITQRTFKFRVYPSKAQTTCLNNTLALCCELYNAGLQERRDAYRLERKSVRYVEQANQLPEIKKVREDVASVHSQVLQDVLKRVEKAFDGFFRRVKAKQKAGFPRFRSHKRYDSFTYAQSGFSIVNSKLRLSKIGDVKIKLHRPVEGKVKTLTITRSAMGKWFACFSVEVEPQPLPANVRAVGIDVGLNSFATLSTGEQIANPRFFRTDEKALAKAQRCEKRKAARRIHERITNRRRNFAHQLSRALVSMFSIIAFEDLNIKGMVKNHCLSKSIHDAAWNQLIQYTTYKAADAGRCVRTVDPRGTSQRCSACGAIVQKDLSQRIHDCSCGLRLDRDHNAAINILTRGLTSLGLTLKEAPSF